MAKNNTENTLKIAIALILIVFVIELIGSFLSGSLALFSDSVHMFGDVFALIASLSAIILAKKLPTKTKTFGYHRTEILAALLNGILLIGMSGFILFNAYQRLYSPKPIESTTMFFIAMIGLLVNIYVAFKLHGSHDLNAKSAFTHVLTDTISSFAVILASIWIFFTNQTFVDPLLSGAIAVLILVSAFSIIKESVSILLEFTPKGIHFDDVIKDIEKVKGIQGVHNVHIWSLCSNINVIDAHILTREPGMAQIEKMKSEIKEKLKKYDIKHATLEFECKECIINGKVRKVKH